MRLMRRFLRDVGSKRLAEADLNLNNMRFTVPESLSPFIEDRGQLVYAGRYLGKNMRYFQPSSILLQELAGEQGTRKAYVSREAGWLFVCGKDIFEENITGVDGELKPGAYYLVMMGGDCLGYGRFETSAGRRVIRNAYDIGDFLRREG